MLINNFFLLISGLLILSSFLVIFANHPVFSALFLVLSFILSSFILFLMECELIALLFITIYVGAIAVLFLFAIMMLDFKNNSLKKNLTKYMPIGVIFGGLLLYPLNKEISSFFGPIINLEYLEKSYKLDWQDLSDSLLENEAIGYVLYNNFFLQFLVVGLILLVVLLGVAHLMSNISLYKMNKQIMFKQLSRSTFLKNKKNNEKPKYIFKYRTYNFSYI
jgi:NADH-quinone oxidoreductase subunit J